MSATLHKKSAMYRRVHGTVAAAACLVSEANI